jgi:hypothetical protein
MIKYSRAPAATLPTSQWPADREGMRVTRRCRIATLFARLAMTHRR